MKVEKYINEVWKPIPGYVGLYEVSNFGRVRSLTRVVYQQNHFHEYKGRILVPCVAGGGYLKVTLYKDNKAKQLFIHRLVAEAFIPNPLNLPQVNHKDEDKTNNCVWNLEWCDGKYNVNYGTCIERANKKRGIPVYQYTLDGVFVKRWDSATDAANFLHVSVTAICNCCKGKCRLKTIKGFIWKYGE